MLNNSINQQTDYSDECIHLGTKNKIIHYLCCIIIYKLTELQRTLIGQQVKMKVCMHCNRCEVLDLYCICENYF